MLNFKAVLEIMIKTENQAVLRMIQTPWRTPLVSKKCGLSHILERLKIVVYESHEIKALTAISDRQAILHSKS